jgi:hypothetical protein
MAISQRKLKAFVRAENLCREVREQIVKGGGIYDNHRLYDLLTAWMRKAGKRSYERSPQRRKPKKKGASDEPLVDIEKIRPKSS